MYKLLPEEGEFFILRFGVWKARLESSVSQVLTVVFSARLLLKRILSTSIPHLIIQKNLLHAPNSLCLRFWSSYQSPWPSLWVRTVSFVAFVETQIHQFYSYFYFYIDWFSPQIWAPYTLRRPCAAKLCQCQPVSVRSATNPRRPSRPFFESSVFVKRAPSRIEPSNPIILPVFRRRITITITFVP